jgi:cytoskeletal protein RodZ
VLLALLAAAVVLAGVLAVLLSQSRGQAPAAAAPTPTTSAAVAPAPEPVPTATPTPSATATTATPTTTTAAPTTEPTTTTSTPPATADGVGLVRNYYGLLPRNTDAAWQLLGPTARGQSGGRGGFDRFYAGLSAVSAENVRTAGDNSVAATIVFVRNDGTTSRESYRFVVGDGVIQSFST